MGAPPARLRISVLSYGLAADWHNPSARQLRSLLRELGQAGHEVMVFEPAGNPSLVSQMRACGAAFLRDFERQAGPIQRYTFPLTSGQDLTIWLVRTLATFDACLVDARLPEELLRKVGQLTPRGIATLLYDPTGQLMAGGPAWWEATAGAHYHQVVTGSEALAERYRAVGAGSVAPLPPWADEATRPVAASQAPFDLTLVGEGVADTPALLALAALAEALPGCQLRLVADGDGGEGEAAVVAAGVTRIPPCERRVGAGAYTGTRLALHVPHSDLRLSARPLEALAHGVPVVALGWDGAGLLQPGQDFAAAASIAGLAATIGELLDDEPSRQALARRGRATVMMQHTSTVRAATLHGWLSTHLTRRAAAPPDAV